MSVGPTRQDGIPFPTGVPEEPIEAAEAAASTAQTDGTAETSCPVHDRAPAAGAAGRPTIEMLAGDLLRRAVDIAAPVPGAAPPSKQQQLELVWSGMRLLAACRENPQAAQEFLKNATYEQKELLAGLKDFAAALRASPREAVLGGAATLAKALEGKEAKLAEAEARLENLGPIARGEGSWRGGSEVSGSRSGSAHGALGSARGQVSGRAGVSGSARGSAQLGLGRAGVEGEAHGLAGAQGAVRGKIDTKLGSVEAGARGQAGATADAAGSASVGLTGAQAQGRARATAGVEADVDAHLRTALLNANARLRGEAQLYAQAEGRATANLREGLRAHGRAEIGARAQVQFDADFRTGGVRIGGERVDLNGEIHAQAEVSARASVEADVAVTYAPPRVLVEAGADAFAGVKAGVQGQVGIGDFITLSGHAEAWAGAGAEAGLVAGYDDGKLRFGFNLGAAIGVGYGVGFAIEIDVASIANAAIGGAIDLAEGAIDFLLNPIDGICNIAEDIASLFVGPDDQPIDYGRYPQLALLFPPIIFGEGIDKEEADEAARRCQEAVMRAARDARLRAAQMVRIPDPEIEGPESSTSTITSTS